MPCDPLYAEPAARAVLRAAGIRAVQSTPLFTRGGVVLGMLSTHYPVPHRPSDRQLRLLDLFARQAADFIEHRQTQAVREELLARERVQRAEAEAASRAKPLRSRS